MKHFTSNLMLSLIFLCAGLSLTTSLSSSIPTSSQQDDLNGSGFQQTRHEDPIIAIMLSSDNNFIIITQENRITQTRTYLVFYRNPRTNSFKKIRAFYDLDNFSFDGKSIKFTSEHFDPSDNSIVDVDEKISLTSLLDY